MINRSGTNPLAGGQKPKLTGLRADRININGSIQTEVTQLESVNKIKASVASLARDSHPTVIGSRDSKQTLGAPKINTSVNSANPQTY